MGNIDKIKKIILGNWHLKKWSAKIYTACHNNKLQVTSGNIIVKDFAFLSNTRIRIIGRNNIIKIEDVSVLKNCHIHIAGNYNSIRIGGKSILYCMELHIEDDNNAISIGDQTTIYGRTHLACVEGCSIIIGADCLFSTDVVFRTGDSHAIIDEAGKRINKSQDIVVGNHVWFGHKTTVLKGVRIQDNSVVATGSIVNDVFIKSNIIIAGIPAKIVKENVNWLRERV